MIINDLIFLLKFDFDHIYLIIIYGWNVLPKHSRLAAQLQGQILLDSNMKYE